MPKKPQPPAPKTGPFALDRINQSQGAATITHPSDLGRGATTAHPMHGGRSPESTTLANLPLSARFQPQPPRQLHQFDDKHPRDRTGRFEPKVRK